MNEDIMPRDFTTAVKDIKLAILQARARAAQLSNVESLKLYFYVGSYISKKTRSAKWGTGAIDALSKRLQVELPGLRGFAASNIKRMRELFEAWADVLQIRPLPMGEIGVASPSKEEISETIVPFIEIRPLSTDEFDKSDIDAFLRIGFTHHALIVEKTKSIDERLYYIKACAHGQWTVETLRAHLRADDYHHIGALPNNFEKTLSPMALATRAVHAFRDEYLLDLINLDNVDAAKDEDIDERVLSKALVTDVEKTIQALGGDDFCFMGREKTVDLLQ